MRALALVLVGLMLGSGGCVKRSTGSTVPERALDLAPRSSLMGEVDELIAAFASGDIGPVAQRMTARLEEELHEGVLQTTSQELVQSFGKPQGIMEEHLQREGDLTWYSGLVAHKRREGSRDVWTPVLYQLGFTPTHQLERLLIREHWFIEELTHPAEQYVPVTRLHVPATEAWTVAQGGPTAELNAHHNSDTQRYAYDLVLVIDGRFRQPDADPTRNEAYYGYGKPLLAPAAGQVVRVVQGIADNVPGERGKAGGNGLVIDHGFGEFSSMWHVRPGSLRVGPGDHVEPGQVVAEVGNTGRSTGAHIHIHLTRGDGEIALPAPFVDITVDGVDRDAAAPVRGEIIESRLPMPAPDLASGPRVLIDA